MPRGHLEDYPRDKKTMLAKSSLFPRLDPPLKDGTIREAIKEAFERAQRTRGGKPGKLIDTPEKLVEVCLRHLKERNDPIIGSSFLASMDAGDVFEMDAVSHEMQRYRMKIGNFYQYLLLRLMRASAKRADSPIQNATDGKREGDVEADIEPDGGPEIRLYISVKKSKDTVGGQDIPSAMDRLEDVARADQNRTAPYLCVVAIGGPSKGRIGSYEKSRELKYLRGGNVVSYNCEIWGPGFVFPYITGRSASYIYKEASKVVGEYLPFYSLKFRKESSKLLVEALKEKGIATLSGRILSDRLFDYMVKEAEESEDDKEEEIYAEEEGADDEDEED
ncbi:MAG: hypothetical protein ABSB26_01270 [Nitrososphaerales archaeon]